jgi:tetratricopeptide (TPR) repeat protein
LADHREKTEDLTLKEKLIAFLTRYTYLIVAVVGVAAVILISIVVYTVVMNSRIEKSSVMAEELVDTFEEWRSADDADKPALEEEIRARAEVILEDYSKLYAGARAAMVVGNLDSAMEQWEAAEKSYMKVAETFPKSYLAPVALMSAAVCREESADASGALDLYRKIGERYAESSPVAAHAVFSLGRLNESLNDREGALEAYNRVVDNFSSSNWTKPARSRIIYLETQ